MPQIPLGLNPETSQQLQQQALDQQLNAQPEVSQQAAAPAYTASLMQNETNQLIDVPQDDLEVAVRSGKYSPKRDAEFVTLDKYGTKHVVLGEDLAAALDSGMLLENSEQRRQRELQEQYGDQEVKAAIEGTARGALGLGSLASQAIGQIPGLEGVAFTPDEAMVGVSKLAGDNFSLQEFRDRAEANPTVSMIGDIAGQIGTFGGVGGAKGVAAIEQQVAKAVLKDATKAGLSNKIAATLASKAAGSAVEGAYFGAGQLVSEDSIGTADLNAENLAIYMGTGALINGALGTAIGAASAALPAIKSIGKMIAKPVLDTAEASIDQQVSAARLLGLTPNQLAKVEARSPGVIKDMQTYLKDDLQLGMIDNAGTLAAKNEAIAKRAGAEIGGVLDEMSVALKNAPELQPTSAQVWGNVWDKTYKKFEEFLGANSPGTAAEKRQISKFLNEVEGLRKQDGIFDARQLQNLKKIQDDLINYDKAPGKWTLKQDLAHLTRSALKSEIDEVASKLETAGLGTDYANRLKAANRQYAASSTFGDFIDAKALKSADRDWTFISSAKEVGLDISRKLAVLGKLEGAKQTVEKLTSKAISGLTNPKLVKTANVARQYTSMSIMDSVFAQSFQNDKYKKPKNTAEAFSNMQKNFDRYTQDPEAFTKRVNRSTSSIYKQAPNTSMALDVLSIQAGMFLSSKMPKRTSNPGMLAIADDARPPSQADLSKFERYIDAIERPENVFKAMENGRIAREHVEAIKAVYPQMYFKLQNKALDALKKDKKIPYNRKLQIGMLLDIPADESLLPENVLALQASFGPQQPDETGNAPAVNTSQGGLKNLGMSDRSESSTESVQNSLSS